MNCMGLVWKTRSLQENYITYLPNCQIHRSMTLTITRIHSISLLTCSSSSVFALTSLHSVLLSCSVLKSTLTQKLPYVTVYLCAESLSPTTLLQCTDNTIQEPPLHPVSMRYSNHCSNFDRMSGSRRPRIL